MADQDAQDLTQMMSATGEVGVTKTPRKSKFIWIVLGCIVVGVGLGIVVYQQSTKTVTPPPTIKVTPAPLATPSPIGSPVTPGVSLVEPLPHTVSYPKAGKVRIYYVYFPGGASWKPLGINVVNGAATKLFTAPGGAVSTPMQIVDTGYALPGPATLTIDTYLDTNSTQLGLGWAAPVSNQCGFNGFGVINVADLVTWATAQSAGEPIVSVQCWADWSPNPRDTSAKDFNDYFLIWSYTPSASASPSTAASASPSTAASSSPSTSPSISPSPSPSPSPSRAASPSPSSSSISAATPTPSARVAMPDTTGGTPVTGIFEVTVGTVSVALILMVVGLFGLLVL